MDDGRILWLFLGGICSFSAKLLEMRVSHRHCETLGGSSIVSPKNANVRGPAVLLGMKLRITLHMEPGQRTGRGAQVHAKQGRTFSPLHRRLVILGQPYLRSHDCFRKGTVIFGYVYRTHDNGQPG